MTSAISTDNGSTTSASQDTSTHGAITSSNDECTTYCYCNGIDDGTKMICCDNDSCASGQWFHSKLQMGSGIAKNAVVLNMHFLCNHRFCCTASVF